ncbi:acyl carrier protein [Aliikangiella sp. IMCC44653]
MQTKSYSLDPKVKSIENWIVQDNRHTDKIPPNYVRMTNMTLNHVAISTKKILIETLSLDITPEQLDQNTLLLGNIPEFDSMAIVSVITALEEEFGFMADDDDLSADVFESVGSLIEFVESKK